MNRTYGKWPELVKTVEIGSWKAFQSLVAGIDIGTTSTQAVVMGDGKILGWASIPTGSDFAGVGYRALKTALGDSDLSQSMLKLASTGWGAKHITSASMYDEVTCHALGGRFLYGKDVHTVVDMGGQTVKAIRLYDWNRVRDVMINDKCATGMGRSIETMCSVLQIPLSEVGKLSLDAEPEPEPVSTTCLTYALSETLGLFGRPEFRSDPLSENQIYASFLYAIAWRIIGVIGKLQPLDVGDVRAYEKLAFTGGLANNIGITYRISRELKTELLESPYDPILAGAIGAALSVTE